jgi:O-antigen/teichoic acid export membrane protein
MGDAADGGSAPKRSLRQRTFHAVKWASVLNLVIQGGQFLLQFLLARILGPEVFGLGARLLAVGSILDRASEFGFNAALIQRDDLGEKHRSTAFYMNIALAVSTALLGVAAVRIYAGVAGWSPFLEVLQYAVFLPLVMALGHVQRSLMIRRLDYKTQTVAQALAISTYIGVGVGLALAGFGVWSILAGFACNYAVLATVFWITSDWRPKWLFHLGALRELFGFGLYVALSRTLYDLGKYLPVLLIGSLLGDVRAGLFSIGYKVGYATVGQVVAVLGSVLFSSFSRLQKDTEGLKRAYLDSLRLMAQTSLILVVVAYAVVPVLPWLMGDEWFPVVPVARVLCFASIWWGLGADLMPPILLGAGRPDLRFAATAFTVIGLVISLLIGAQFELIGACVAVSLFYAVNNVVYQVFIARTIHISLLEILRRSWAPFVAFCCAAGVVEAIERSLDREGFLWAVALACVTSVAALVVYAGIIHVADRRAWPDLVGTLKGIMASRGAGKKG